MVLGDNKTRDDGSDGGDANNNSMVLVAVVMHLMVSDNCCTGDDFNASDLDCGELVAIISDVVIIVQMMKNVMWSRWWQQGDVGLSDGVTNGSSSKRIYGYDYLW